MNFLMSGKRLPCFTTFFAILVFAVSANTLPAVLLRAAATLRVDGAMLAAIASIQFAGFFLATLAGFAFSGIWPLIVGLAAARTPQFSGTVIGLTIAVGSLGCILAAPAMRWLFIHLPHPWIFPMASLPLLLAAGALFLSSSRPGSICA